MLDKSAEEGLGADAPLRLGPAGTDVGTTPLVQLLGWVIAVLLALSVLLFLWWPS